MSEPILWVNDVYHPGQRVGRFNTYDQAAWRDDIAGDCSLDE